MSKTLYLASQSPRRWQLLQNLGLDLLPLESEIDETPFIGEEAKAYCLRMAEEKNHKAAQVCQAKQLAPFPILTADTTVSLNGKILGKPKDTKDAFNMLNQLSGKTHQVYTALCLSTQNQCHAMVQTSDVTFRSLSEKEIHAYIATQEPMDKAGGYGIQQLGGTFVCHLSGSFTGVMGLPIFEIAELLKKVEISLL